MVKRNLKKGLFKSKRRRKYLERIEILENFWVWCLKRKKKKLSKNYKE